MANKIHPKDLTGMVFGRLKVIEKVEGTGGSRSNRPIWVCECTCENKTLVQVKDDRLKSNNTKSCGCLQREAATKLCKSRAKGVEVFDEKEDDLGKYIEFQNNHGDKCQVDLEDFEKIKNISWCKEKAGYWRGKDPEQNKVVRLHNFLCPNFALVDHEDRNKSNNRRYNLREAKHYQNTANQKRSKKKYEVYGISPLRSGKWKSIITCKGTFYNLGAFENKEQAIVARLTKEKELLGEFAPQRHLFEQYGI